MTEKKIIKALFSFVNKKGHKYMCSNTQCIPGVGEADFLSVTGSSFIIEYEIKVSRSDFKADFKNKVNKHKRMSGTPIDKKKYMGYDNIAKKSIYKDIKEVGKPFVNYFYFVVPRDLVSINEVPYYAGLIYVDEIKMTYGTRLVCTQVKNPRRFHMNKIKDSVLLNMYRSVMYKYYN